MLSPSDQLLYCAVKLTALKGGAAIGSGTGFFYSIEISNGVHLVSIVTNKHVVDGADAISATFHIGTGDPDAGPSGEVIQASFSIDPAKVNRHPDDGVDVCALGIGEMLSHFSAIGKPIFYVNLRAVDIPTSEEWETFDAIEDVTMVGCPNGLFDESNNIPIVRRGITATPLGKRFNGASEFLVDMACFPGSSGSPIFLFDKVGSYDRKTNKYQIGKMRLRFVGILFAGPLINNKGKIILGQPPSFEVATMMHLGYAVRSSALLDMDAILRASAEPRSH